MTILLDAQLLFFEQLSEDVADAVLCPIDGFGCTGFGFGAFGRRGFFVGEGFGSSSHGGETDLSACFDIAGVEFNDLFEVRHCGGLLSQLFVQHCPIEKRMLTTAVEFDGLVEQTQGGFEVFGLLGLWLLGQNPGVKR